MAVEAVSVAQEKPPTSKSILASSFNSLGTACTALGQYQNAYNAISKGTDLFYELKQEKSDEFKLENLANSLNNLGRTLTSLKQYERAVKELLEVVRFYRILTDDKPNEFKPYLAFSLTSLGIAYAKWGQLENIPASTLENALTSTLEAVQITRDLYIAASAAFAIRYAERLNSLSDRYRELRQFQPAHQNAQMAIKVLCTPFLKSPQALSGLMHRLVLDYCEICDVLKLEPDLEFLNPILSILKSFLQQNTQSPNL